MSIFCRLTMTMIETSKIEPIDSEITITYLHDSRM